ncbi:hypothetical protein SEA_SCOOBYDOOBYDOO_121 [Mycobacterium phage ScoobyDoobyDoo]|nr:hypothetical protein SEA_SCOOBYDOOBYDOO_121 [Mycobacterium phage ScoobyDoobyDoo]
MSMPIQRHQERFAPFMEDAAIYARRDRQSSYDEAEVADMLRGPSIHAGLNDTRRVAVDTRGMDPDSHAYHELDPRGYGETGEWGQSELDDGEYSRYERDAQGVDEDDESGYNWGPEPGYDPGAEPGPHPDFHGDAPHPFGTPIYNPGPPTPSFKSARRSAVADGGPAQKVAWGVMPAQPQQPAEPVWLGHTFAPSHRVALPWRDGVIQGTVTHLDGTNVGVRWDDGQHSVEEPSAIRPLY